jgi:hypothetical protein
MTTVDARYVEQYAEEGATMIPGAFAGAWARRLLAAHDRLCERAAAAAQPTARGHRMYSAGADEHRPALQYMASPDGGFSLRNAVFHDPDFAAWLRESPAAELVGRVTGARTVRFWFDLSFGKEGDRPEVATAWHTDIGSFSFLGDQLPSFWIALTDVPEDNAPMITLAGSHADKRQFRPVFGREEDPLPEGYAELAEIRRAVEAPGAPLRTWPMQAGDVLLIHPYCYHASLPRTHAAGRRLGFSSRWLGDDVRWVKRELTFDYPEDPRFRNVRQGEPAPDDGFPVLWRRPAAERAA